MGGGVVSSSAFFSVIVEGVRVGAADVAAWLAN